MQIHIGVWDNKYDSELFAHRSEEGLEKRRQHIANEQWDDEFPNDPKPVDPKEAADEYFHRMGTGGMDEEWFNTHTLHLED